MEFQSIVHCFTGFVCALAIKDDCMFQLYAVFGILAVTLILFIWGRWRYDVVACLALMGVVLIGVIPFADAFRGFANPAVITVACVMIISQSITQSGLVDKVVKALLPVTSVVVLHIGFLTIITAVLSAFMNNVGALALMMPVAIQTAHQHKRSPAMVLMPLAFASVLGGMTTLIGTPPNLLISAYREQVTGHPYLMFDFSPVGLLVAGVAILFIAVIGWRLTPYKRKSTQQGAASFQLQDYVTEIVVPEGSPFVDKTLRDLENSTTGDFAILGLIRGKRKRLALAASECLVANDILIIEASHDDLQRLLQEAKLELVGGEIVSAEILRSDDIGLVEAVVPPGSRMDGRSWQAMRIRSRFRLNLLAIARQGKSFRERLNRVKLHAGDVLLLQGQTESLQEYIGYLGLLPLLERGVDVGMRRQALLPLLIFSMAIIAAAMRLLPIQISFTMAVLLLVLFNVLSVRKLYDSIDWSVIVLLGAMIPVGQALQMSGGTDLIAQHLLSLASHFGPKAILIFLLVSTMLLTDLMNNAATAVLMAPLAVSIANALNVNMDTFLMAVAVGASCSFLTPIGHQNNTLVMGPGGYQFSDYYKLGLPVSILVVSVAIPMLLFVWGG